MKKAFTLIELLVVIAIIAILAAILFPVFAQAKAAAKNAASISNSKQVDLGILMYTNDNDDNLPIAVIWYDTPGQQSGAGACYGSTDCLAAWAWAVQPYLKNSGILQDPLAPQTATGQTWLDALYPQFGYNLTYLSPWNFKTNPYSWSSKATTSFSRPAETLAIAAKFDHKEASGDYAYWTVQGPYLDVDIEPVDCNDIAPDCVTGWGTDSEMAAIGLTTDAQGLDTGGISQRRETKMVTAWLDGHSRVISPGALAIGTTWAPDKPQSNTTLNTNWLTVNLWGDQ